MELAVKEEHQIFRENVQGIKWKITLKKNCTTNTQEKLLKYLSQKINFTFPCFSLLPVIKGVKAELHTAANMICIK